MDEPGPALPPLSDKNDTLEDGIDILFEELAFAIRWRRPSILLVFYENEEVRVAAELALEKRLIESRHPVIAIGITEQAFDIPLALSRRPDRRKAIYFVDGLAQGGGRDGANAYRALNMRRELLVDRPVRAVFWLRGDEAVELSRHAPDFWAFRHRVVELGSPPDAETIEALLGGPSDRDWSRPGEDDYLDARIVLRERLLGDLHERELSVLARVRLLSSLAGLYRVRGDPSQALRLLQQSMELTRQLNQPGLLAWHWGHLGLIHADLGEMEAALQACKKAVELQPLEPGLWDCLGEIRLAAGQAEAALSAFQRAGEIDPRDVRGWYGLGCVYHQTGRTQAALAGYRKAVRFDRRHAGAWNRLGALFLEMHRPEDALTACKKALRLVPRNAGCWEGLGQVLFTMNAVPDAIIAYQNAAGRDPKNSIFHSTLALLYHVSRQDSLAEVEMEIVRSRIKDEPEYRQAVFEAVSGDTGRARGLLEKALKTKQAGWSSAGFEPAFGSMRDDPGFAALLGRS